MTNYTKTTDFAAKDSLPSGDSGKIIRGSEFETEFDNIATAVNSKSDANNPTFTGTVTIDGLTVNGNTILGNAATDTVTVTADIASNLIPSADDTYNLGAVGAEWNDLHVDGTAYIDDISGGSISGTSFASTGNMTFGDNNEIQMGNTGQFRIFTNGSDSRIQENYGGNLRLLANNIQLESYSGEKYFRGVADGEVNLYYDSNTKLTTTATGIDVTGSAVIDTTSGQLTIKERGSASVELETESTGSLVLDTTSLEVEKNGTKRMVVAGSSGDISFYEDTGTTAKFFWDASTERLGIGNSAPTTALDVTGTIKGEGLQASSANPGISLFESDTTDLNAQLNSNFGSFRIATVNDVGGSYTQRINVDHATGDISFYEDTGTTPKFRWDASAESLGIGTSSPSYILDLQNATGGVLARFKDSDSSHNGIVIAGDTAAGWVGNNALTTGEGIYYQNSLNAMRMYTSGSERVRIDASGNVGIGTSSPTNNLDIAAASSATLSIRNTSTVSSILLSNGSSANQVFSRGVNSSTGRDLAFVQGTAEAMRIDSGGRVGIGTTSPAAKINTKGNDALLLQTAPNDNYGFHVTLAHGANMAKIGALDSADGSKDGSTITFGDFGRNIEFSTNKGASLSEAMRIDSSGNLLVGKTSTSIPTVGIEARSDGVFAATRAGNTVGFFNRTTSDGAIVDFRKDNTSVGSIGSSASQPFFAGTSNGFRLSSGGVVPSNSSGANADNAYDLGGGPVRWKDLYLSGGAYLGGTAAANKLDDYEEGTFNPTYEPSTGSFTTLTMDVVQAKYTKVGNTVAIAVWVRTDDVDITGASGALRISGLPFTVDGFTSLVIGNSGYWGSNHPEYAFTGGSGTDYITLQYKSAINADPNNLGVTDLQTGTTANQNQLFISGTYFTTA